MYACQVDQLRWDAKLQADHGSFHEFVYCVVRHEFVDYCGDCRKQIASTFRGALDGSCYTTALRHVAGDLELNSFGRLAGNPHRSRRRPLRPSERYTRVDGCVCQRLQ